MTAEEVIALLGLEPLPREGGFYAETYRSPRKGNDGSASGKPRSLATAIYYLLTPSAFSALHRLPADEVYHFYCGDPVEMLLLGPDGSGETVILGSDLAAGQRPQRVVEAGVWQGSRLVPGGAWALLGTTMAPGFAPEDFEPGDRSELIRRYPGFSEHIVALTLGRNPRRSNEL